MDNSTQRNTQKMTADTITAAIRRAGTAKEIARLCGVSFRTVEGWQQGKSHPSGPVLLRLMSKSREVAQTILASMGLTEEWLLLERTRIDREIAAIQQTKRLPDETAMASATPSRNQSPDSPSSVNE